MLELVACGGLLLALDQWSKRLALDSHDGRSTTIRPARRSIINPRSIARSTGGKTSLLAVWIGALVCAVALTRTGAWFQSGVAQLGLAAAFGGAAGNLTDMLRRRAVVDFIDLRWWPLFNLADVAIVGGLALAFAFN
jgi:lipoprotein signal peptidase